MRKALMLVIVLGAASCGGKTPPPAGPAVEAPPPTPKEVVEQVTAHVEQYRQGIEVRSLEALAPLYSQTDDLVSTFQGRTVRGWANHAEQLSGFFANYQTVKLRLDDLQVVGIGDRGAFVTAAAHRTYSDGVQSIEERGTLTVVLRRTAAGWQIVGEHFSYAPQQ